MAITSVLGGQWGDEGKGKIVDLLSENVHVVARFQGGANAGHTVFINDKKFVLHQIPSGILRTECHCVLGNGMVIDPISLLEEIDMLKQNGIDPGGRIHIALNSHFVTPVHRAIDRASEAASDSRIGTTCRGIGPTYVDKYNRRGIRGHNLQDGNQLKSLIDTRLEDAVKAGELHGMNPQEVRDEFDQFLACADSIAPFVSDTFTFLHDKISDGANVLVEGAQGTMLDIDHGTYPFVTSSNCSAGGIANGTGIPVTSIDRRIGIFKAYTTRVGEGPFPTELFDETGSRLQDLGGEYGATTGRPRRCGWFDGVLARYSAMVNGLTEVTITKLDVLDSFEEIQVCTHYMVDGEKTRNLSSVLHRLQDVTPVYESVPGWMESTKEIEHFEELPARATRYIQKLSDLMATPVKIVSTGPERQQIITR